MANSQSKGRWVAIVTGAFSIFIAVVYLILITLLDSRGPMRPPPLEALGGVVVVVVDSLEEAQRLYEMPTLRNF